MFDKFFVGGDVISSVNNGKFKPISRVTLLLDDSNAITAGDDTGREIVANCPHATQTMVDALLDSLKGYEYQAYEASSANIDPSAELGDGVTVGGIYSVIAKMRDDGSGYASLSAPGEAELEDEYPMDGPMTQMFNRELKKVGSSITKTAEEIRLEVAAFVQSVSGDVSELQSSITQTAKDIRLEISNLTQSVDGSITDLQSSITQTAKDIRLEISDLTKSVDGDISNLQSSITQTAKDIRLEISNLTENVSGDISDLQSSISQTAKNIRLEISNLTESVDGSVEDLRSSITQTAKDIRLEINNLTESVNGEITDLESSITQTAASIRLEVSQTIGDLGEYGSVSSMIEQTASSIRNEVSGFVDGEYVSSSISTALEGLSLSASSSNGTTTLTLKGGETELSTKSLKLSVDAAHITGTLTIGQLPEDVATMEDIPDTRDFALSEDVPQRLSDLINAAADVTTIVKGTVTAKYINAMAITAAYVSADGITAGTLDASFLSLDGLLELKNDDARGYVGANNEKGGAVLSSEDMNVFVIANDSAAKLSYWEEHKIWVHSGGCYSSETIQVFSDRTMKDNINYDLSEEENLFSTLLPCSFSYISDKNSKKHWGFIAQDFIGSAEGLGMDTDKLAVIGEYEGKYSIGYGEITALNTHMIQKLMRRVAALESRLEE